MFNSNNKISIFNFIILAFILACVIPFVILSFYAMPNLEDYKESIIPEVWWHIKFLYLTYDGRYFSSFLFAAFNPLKHESYFLYKLIPVGLIFSFYGAIFYLIKTVLRSLNNFESFILAGLVFSFYLLLNPSIPYTLYYMISSYVYTVTTILFVFLIALLFKLNTMQEGLFKLILVSAIAVLIFAICGGNELLLIPTLSAILFYSFFSNKLNSSGEVFVLWIAFLASIFIVFTSPGLQNFFELKENNSFSLFSILNSLKTTIAFSFIKIKTWAFNLSFLSMSIILLIYLLSLKNKLKQLFHNIPYKTLVVYFFWFILSSLLFVFPYVFSTGEQANVSYNQAYIVPYVYFISSWCIFLLLIVLKFNFNYKMSFSSLIIILVAIGAIFSQNNKISTAYNDLISGEAKKYYIEMLSNKESSKNAELNNKIAHVCELNAKPSSIYSGVYFNKDDEGFHGAYKIYYNLEQINVNICE